MTILLELLVVALLALACARLLPPPWRGRAMNAFKLYLTVRMVWLLLLWPVNDETGAAVPAWRMIGDVIGAIDASTFWTFAAAGALIRFVGVLASMLRWLFVLIGQGIELPFRHIFGAFLIGRAIGFFLPSTAGLDAYKLYDASRFTGRTVEVTAGTVLEKVLGVTGIFLTFLVALPFGYAIFGENAGLAAAVTVTLSTAVIGGLLTVLWYPGLVQWGLRVLPLPGKARLEGVLTRISNAAAAYRRRKPLVLLLLFFSFAVHFTTAAMYYFMALAVGAGAKAAFWPIVFGSAIQIFATVIGPTIGGLGVREAAQLLTLGSIIGPGVAIVSATLGFWVGEVPTLFGFLFWVLRGSDYKPAYCLVNGEQVNYEEAAKAALELETAEEREARGAASVAEAPPFGTRALRSAATGVAAGIVGGLLIGAIEAFVIARGGFAGEAQVLWYGPLAYAAVLGGLGLLGGLALAVLPMDLREIRGWTSTLALMAMMVPMGLFITLFRLRRDVYLEQMPPAPVLLGVLGAFGVLAVALFFVGPRLFRGAAGLPFRLPVALGLAALVGVGGAFAAGRHADGAAAAPAPPAVPSALAERPNLILIMVDTLRADHLGCYGHPRLATPAICNLAAENGTRYEGFSHASWTKPAAASLLTSLLPSTHGAVSKPAALPQEADLVSEALKGAGYSTGAIVSNINLAPSFGFDQGYDEYHYLAPDYIAGASESSSKLILYQLARRIWFRIKPGLRVGDFYQDSDTVNAVAFDWLERHRDARFFLFLHYMDPHDPYFAHPYDGTGIDRATHQEPDPAMSEDMLPLYEGEIAFLDANIARLTERLRELGLYENSLIVLTSDHGEEFHEHGGFWHGLTLYDEQIRVPLLVKWPAGQRGAEPVVNERLARLIDVAPTLITAGGAPVPPSMQGRPLFDLLDRSAEKDRLHFAEEDHEGNVLRAVRTEQWKWIEANEGNPRGLPPEELFAVGDDPLELQNVLEREPATARELAGAADRQEEYARGQSMGGGETAEITREECERLAVLGYADMEDCKRMN